MKIAVYCSAKDSIPEEYKQLGRELGAWLAEHGHSLVYGGATGGLMSSVSNAFCEAREREKADGKVIGVIPGRIIRSGRKADNCDELIVVTDMAERKRIMRETADCFIVLPGSYGTLDELFDVVASGTIGEHKKPLYIMNYHLFYAGLQQEAAHMRELKFLPAEESYKPVYVDTLEELQNYLQKQH